MAGADNSAELEQQLSVLLHELEQVWQREKEMKDQFSQVTN